MLDFDLDEAPRVLVADDAEGLVSMVMQALLEPMGCRVEAVEDPAEIIERLRRGRYAALVTERGRSPDGLALARSVIETPGLQHVPVLLVGSDGELDDASQAFISGVRGMLTTPIRLGEVVEALTDCMARPAA